MSNITLTGIAELLRVMKLLARMNDWSVSGQPGNALVGIGKTPGGAAAKNRTGSLRP
jgi:hypothetical protein